jgi:predicted small secreted protein
MPCYTTKGLTDEAFSFQEEGVYVNNINDFFKKFPSNDLTSDTSISVSFETERDIYEALMDIKKGKVTEVSGDKDILEALSE